MSKKKVVAGGSNYEQLAGKNEGDAASNNYEAISVVKKSAAKSGASGGNNYEELSNLKPADTSKISRNAKSKKTISRTGESYLQMSVGPRKVTGKGDESTKSVTTSKRSHSKKSAKSKTSDKGNKQDKKTKSGKEIKGQSSKKKPPNSNVCKIVCIVVAVLVTISIIIAIVLVFTVYYDDIVKAKAAGS